MRSKLVPILLNSVPGWVRSNYGLLVPSVVTHYDEGRAWVQGFGTVDPTSLITTVRASTGYAATSAGGLNLFQANIPRITDLGLLVEQAATNIALQSQAFDATWAPGHAGAGSDAVVTADAGTAPDGTLTADRVRLALNGATTTSDQSFIGQAITVSNTTAYVATIYLKSNTASSYAAQLVDSSGSGITNITITPAWQRFTLLETTGGTAWGFRVRLRGGQTPTNSDSADILAWGAQLELGSFPTSYIPTTTVSVTRAADVITTVANWSRYFSLTGGSVRTVTSGLNLNSTAFILSTTSDNTFSLARAISTASIQSKFAAGQVALATTFGSGTTAGTAKYTLGWDGSGRSAVANNGTLVTDSNAPSGVDSALSIGSTGTGTTQANGYIQRITAWNARLSNAQLQALTT